MAAVANYLRWWGSLGSEERGVPERCPSRPLSFSDQGGGTEAPRETLTSLLQDWGANSGSAFQGRLEKENPWVDGSWDPTPQPSVAPEGSLWTHQGTLWWELLTAKPYLRAAVLSALAPLSEGPLGSDNVHVPRIYLCASCSQAAGHANLSCLWMPDKARHRCTD